jgi:predicted transcriptional regulator
MEIPEKLENEMHPRADRALAARILNFINTTPAACIADVGSAVGCADITACKHLRRMVRAGLATETRIGHARVFIKNDERGVEVC